MIPNFNTREEYEAYMKKLRNIYEISNNKTTNGASIPITEIRKFQLSRGICTTQSRENM